MKITVEVKNVYGIDRIYPVCDKAKALLALTHNKTFSDAHISRLKSLGYELVVKTPEL